MILYMRLWTFTTVRYGDIVPKILRSWEKLLRYGTALLGAQRTVFVTFCRDRIQGALDTGQHAKKSKRMIKGLTISRCKDHFFKQPHSIGNLGFCIC